MGAHKGGCIRSLRVHEPLRVCGTDPGDNHAYDGGAIMATSERAVLQRMIQLQRGIQKRILRANNVDRNNVNCLIFYVLVYFSMKPVL
jgi:hypothetical protein